MQRYFKFHLPKSQFMTALFAGLGTAIGIGVLTFASHLTTVALLMAPFGASCVLLFAAPSAPLSQPINVVLGHLVSAGIGLVIFMYAPMGEGTSALAVGLAVAAMVALRVVHPPAGATALVAGLAGSWSFLFFPVLTGSLALVLVATLYHRAIGNTYPLK